MENEVPLPSSLISFPNCFLACGGEEVWYTLDKTKHCLEQFLVLCVCGRGDSPFQNVKFPSKYIMLTH